MIHCIEYSQTTKSFNKGTEFVGNYVPRNVSWEVQKAIAIQTMNTAMTELVMGIVQSSDFAGGFSSQIVRR